MIPVRVMKEEGERQFMEFINQVKLIPSYPKPDLNDSQYSEEFQPRVEVNEREVFQSKLQLAEYLDECFGRAGLKREDIIANNGLWTWLAYLWFDSLAPVNPATGKRPIREMAKYMCSSDYRDYYRHFIAGPYMIYSLHGKKNSRVFLYSPIYEHNDFIEQIASRQFIIAHRNLIETFSKLYLDNNSGTPKRGAQSRSSAGNIRRFVKIIQQFELTFDLYDMEPQQIIDLLPAEFYEWKR